MLFLDDRYNNFGKTWLKKFFCPLVLPLLRLTSFLYGKTEIWIRDFPSIHEVWAEKNKTAVRGVFCVWFNCVARLIDGGFHIRLGSLWERFPVGCWFSTSMLPDVPGTVPESALFMWSRGVRPIQVEHPKCRTFFWWIPRTTF